MTDDVRKLLAGYVDNELTDEERARVEDALTTDPELRAELEEFRKLKEVTGMMRYADLPSEVWDSYWQSLYRKLERGVGLIIFSLGAIVLLAFGAWEFLRALWITPGNPIWLKLGISAVVLGGIILFVSYARERFFAYKRDRYGEVER